MSNLVLIPALLGMVSAQSIQSVTVSVSGKTTFSVNRDNGSDLTVSGMTAIISKTTTVLSLEDEELAERLRLHLVSINTKAEEADSEAEDEEEEEEEKPRKSKKPAKKAKRAAKEEDDIDTSAYGEGGSVIITDAVVLSVSSPKIVHISEVIGAMASAIAKFKNELDEKRFKGLHNRLSKGTWKELVTQAYPVAGAGLSTLPIDATRQEVVAASSSISPDTEKARALLNRYYDTVEKYLSPMAIEKTYSLAELETLISNKTINYSSMRELVASAAKESIV